MKKTIAILLTMLMLVSMLAGCGEKAPDNADNSKLPTANNEIQNNEQTEDQKQNETQQNTQPKAEAAVGDVLDAPEVSFDENTEDLYIYFTYPGDEKDEVLSMELAIDQVNEDTYVIYMSDGLLKLHEVIYEVTDAGVTKYYKDAFMESFALETELTQTELEQEKASMLSLLSTFMLAHPDLEGVKYRKSDAPAFALTGDVYVYDMIEAGEVAGQICIDKATGLMVSLKDTDGTALYSVQAIKTSDLGIPAYK